MIQKSLDNVTAILITFSNIENKYLENVELGISHVERVMIDSKPTTSNTLIFKKSHSKLQNTNIDNYTRPLDSVTKISRGNSRKNISPSGRKLNGINAGGDERKKEATKSDLKNIDFLKNQNQSSFPMIKSPR